MGAGGCHEPLLAPGGRCPITRCPGMCQGQAVIMSQGPRGPSRPAGVTSGAETWLRGGEALTQGSGGAGHGGRMVLAQLCSSEAMDPSMLATQASVSSCGRCVTARMAGEMHAECQARRAHVCLGLDDQVSFLRPSPQPAQEGGPLCSPHPLALRVWDSPSAGRTMCRRGSSQSLPPSRPPTPG